MFFLNTIETVDITKELPLEFWLVFALVMAVVLFVAHKLLTRLFVPKPGREEPAVWDKYSKRTPKY